MKGLKKYRRSVQNKRSRKRLNRKSGTLKNKNDWCKSKIALRQNIFLKFMQKILWRYNLSVVTKHFCFPMKHSFNNSANHSSSCLLCFQLLLKSRFGCKTKLVQSFSFFWMHYEFLFLRCAIWISATKIFTFLRRLLSH